MHVYVGNLDTSIRMLTELHLRWPTNFNVLISLLSYSSNLGYWDTYRQYLPDPDKLDRREASEIRKTIAIFDLLSSDDLKSRRQFMAFCEDRLAKQGWLPLNWLAQLNHLGLADEALALADRASFAHMFDPDGPLPSAYYPGTIFGSWCTMNQNPLFVDLCNRMGLCDYWVETEQWPDCAKWLPYDFKAEVRARIKR
jgi:hypothetical protein